MLEVIGSANASTALVLAMQYQQHASIGRAADWPAGPRAKVFGSSLECVSLVNALRVEPDLGTPARGGLAATTARRTDDGWRITGHKQYVTGIPALRWLMVWARTDDAEPLVGWFLVDARSAGIRVVETWDHLGMRATCSHDVLFDDVLIPADHAVGIGAPGAPPAVAEIVFMGWNCIAISSVYHGAALAARDWLVRYLHERVPSNLGASLATLPRFHAAVGEIESLLAASSMLLRSTAAGIDAGDRSACFAASVVKHTVTNNAIRAVDIALALVGNPGLSRKNALERHYRDVLCSRIHTPQDDTILLGAGRAALRV